MLTFSKRLEDRDNADNDSPEQVMSIKSENNTRKFYSENRRSQHSSARDRSRSRSRGRSFDRTARSRSRSGPRSGGKECYNCHKIGHIARFCRNKYNHRRNVRFYDEKCSHCGRSNHSTNNCRLLNYSCNICKSKNHVASNCRYSPRPARSSVNKIFVANNPSDSDSGSIHNEDEYLN